ncbi:MAG: cellulase family glycosylhydrolase [Ignavibacteria bacterium]
MQNNFVTVNNGRFYLTGAPYRFIGANMYELANVEPKITEAMLKDAAEQGFRVIRFWAFEPVKKEKLTEICDISRELDLKLIPVLSDPTGYLQSYKIENDWYREGYKKNYLQLAADIVNGLKDRTEILLWELINEPVTDSFEDIYNFAKDASEKFKTADPNHLISIGTIGGVGDKFGNFFSRFKLSNFEKLYSIKTLDCISIHDYSFNSTMFERLDIMYRLKGKHELSGLSSSLDTMINFIPSAIDGFTIGRFNSLIDFPSTLRSIWRNYNRKNIRIAKKLNKPLYVGEVGFKKNNEVLRKKILERELNNYFKEGIAGVLLWSFESQGKSLDGHDYGFNKENGFGEVVKKISSIIDIKI